MFEHWTKPSYPQHGKEESIAEEVPEDLERAFTEVDADEEIDQDDLAEEMKFDFLNAQLRKGVKNLLQCPICPELKPDYGSAAGKNTN